MNKLYRDLEAKEEQLGEVSGVRGSIFLFGFFYFLEIFLLVFPELDEIKERGNERGGVKK